MLSFNLLIATFLAIVSLAAGLRTEPLKVEERQSTGTSIPAPPVDIGYGIYQGYYNDTSQLNIYKGFANFSIPSNFGANII